MVFLRHRYAGSCQKGTDTMAESSMAGDVLPGPVRWCRVATALSAQLLCLPQCCVSRQEPCEDCRQ